MYGLQVFSYEGNEVRTVQKGSEIFWVLKDVCGILGIEKYRDAAARLDDDERSISSTRWRMALLSVITRGINAASPVTMPIQATGFRSTASQWIHFAPKFKGCSRQQNLQSLPLPTQQNRKSYTVYKSVLTPSKPMLMPC